MEIQIKTFDNLSVTELYDLLKLRSEVFVVEQKCIYLDIDGKDGKALHVLGILEGKIVAYSRIFKAGDYFANTSIGRVVVAKSDRKKGYAKIMMKAAMEHIFNSLKERKIELSAQTYLSRFYTELGFKIVGEAYLEDGIPHRKMIYG
ncbi:GNAT family N-acetyltransferase [Muricauda sp. SCSIO 64092]|uniref:GNAT family N-acetyltransferase n=1 Tax=Allomuricauda sp. SCSIO 64092 TaxID=2908842 RepID=UPI001FF3AE69|nr:GNAT family N-acetyltransferase [Muricauda sp. SCSIO 64092]UOY08872.1 GNAT family N-acetyltransferase [Muricauda sp. SCSIO 64092]